MRILWSGPAFMLSWALLVKFALVDGGYDVLKVNCRKDIISNKKLYSRISPQIFFANHFLILWWLYYEAKRTFFLLCTVYIPTQSLNYGQARIFDESAWNNFSRPNGPKCSTVRQENNFMYKSSSEQCYL